MCRFAVLNCEDLEKWRSTAKQPRPNVEGHINQFVEYFIDTFGDSEDQWKAFSCYDFEWPSIDEARQSFDAVFITGSHHSVLDSEQIWITELCHMIQLYVQENVRIVGICFGAQVLAMALGGRVGKNPGTGVICKLEDLEVLPVFAPFIGEDQKSLAMVEVHSDQVLELPEDAVRFASSKSCVNEIWCLRSVLAVQSHPELAVELLTNRIYPALKQRKLMTAAQIMQNEKILKTKKDTHDVVIKFIKEFTRTPAFMMREPYRQLFPSRLHSTSDALLIEEIKELAQQRSEAPFTTSDGVRNPELDCESKEALQTGLNVVTEQFSTLLLKELRHVMLDYEGIRRGNAVVYENAQGLLRQALELHAPVQELRSERLKMTDEAIQVLKDVTELIQSLEVSAHLLEQQTQALRQRLTAAD